MRTKGDTTTIVSRNVNLPLILSRVEGRRCDYCGKPTPVRYLLCGCPTRLCLRCSNTHKHKA